METGLLKSEDIFGKPKTEPLGSQFGGNWGISDLIKKEEEATEGIKTSAEIFGKPTESLQKAEEVSIPEPIIPKLEDMKVQENNLTAMDKAYEDLTTSLKTDYKLYDELGKQLDDIEAEMEAAPQEMLFSLNEERNKVVTQHNDLVDVLKKNSERHQSLYDQLDNEVKVFNASVNTYNQWMTEQSKKAPELEVDVGDFFTPEEMANRLKEKTYRTGERENPTWGEQLKNWTNAGLNYTQGGFYKALAMVDEGFALADEAMGELRLVSPEKVKKFEEKYGFNPYIVAPLTGEFKNIAKESLKRADKSMMKAETTNKLQQLAAKAIVPAIPVVITGALTGGMDVAMTGMNAIYAAPWVEVIAQLGKMTPFMTMAFGNYASDIEEKAEKTGKELPYWKRLTASAVLGFAEGASELEFFTGMSSLLKRPAKKAVERGAKTLWQTYGTKVGEIAKTMFSEFRQEATMPWIQTPTEKLLGFSVDMSPKALGKESLEQGLEVIPMIVLLTGLGGGIGASTTIAARVERIMGDMIEKKKDVNVGIKEIAKETGLLEEVEVPTEPEVKKTPEIVGNKRDIYDAKLIKSYLLEEIEKEMRNAYLKDEELANLKKNKESLQNEKNAKVILGLEKVTGYQFKEKNFFEKVEPEIKTKPEAKPGPTKTEPKVNPKVFSIDPLSIGRELEFYPDDSALLARQAELIFEQHLKGEKIDYPLYVAKQDLETAKTNLKEKFGNNYPEAEEIIKRAEVLEKKVEAKPKPYTATVYRGTKEGEAPTDEGLFGKGTYYTTNKEYAGTYGEVKETKIELKNPFVIENQKQADDFWNEVTRPARKKAINEGKTPQEANEIAAVAAREYLETKGYDGLIAKNIIEKGDEVVVFEPEKAEVKPTIPKALEPLAEEARNIPPKIEKVIQRIEKLDIKVNEYMKKADGILKVSAVGQPPSIYYTTVDKGLKVAVEKAKLWNDIRSKVVPGTNKTLWQLAIDKNIDVGKYGDEEYLKISAKDIRQLFTKATAKPIEEKVKVEEKVPAALKRPKPIAEASLFEAEPQALSAKQWEVKMEKEAVIPEKINKTEIMTWAGETFGIPLKSKATHKWKSAGTYYPRQQIIRMEKWGELSVLTHEIAHDIDAKIMKATKKRWKNANRDIQTELADLDYDQNQRRTSEGFAEYMRHRLTTGLAEEKAPAFTKYFNEEILPQFPELKKNLETFKEKLDIWNKQGAENRIIQHIDWKGEHTKTRGIGAKLKKALEWVHVRFNDEFYYPQKITAEIEKVIGKELTPSKNPAIMMEYSKSKAGAIARTYVMDKAIDEAGNVVGDGLIDVLRPIADKDMKQFIAYAVSKRAVNLSGRGIESGFDIDDAKFIIEKYKDKGWDGTVNELTKWSNHALDWLVRAGGLDKETTQIMRDLNPVYLPFKRAFIEEAGVFKGAAGYVDTGKGVKGIKGSGRPIINPLESMVTQMRELVAKAQKIRIAKIFIDLSENEGVGGFITKVPAPMKATTFSANQIKGYLDEIAGGEEGITSSNEYNEFLTVFTQDFKYSGKENIVSIWRDGKQEFYEIHPDLYEAFKGVDPLKLGPITKIFAPFSRMLRLGATGLKLSFGLARNPFRDAFSYAVFSKRNNTTVFDPIKGYYKEMTTKPGEPTWRFKKLGGGLSGQIGLDRASVQNSYDEMLETRLGAIGKVLKVVKHPVNTLADLVSITEMGPRSAEIEASYKKYTSEKWLKDHKNWTEEDAFIQAFCDAQDVTVNFTKSGKWAKQINQVTAFFNVSIRGPEKLYRSFKERPIQTFVKGAMWCSLIAIGSWYKNRDKDWYKNLPTTYKYSNLFFEIGKEVYRLPIPFELGIVFMAAPQAVLDTYYGKDDKAIEGLINLAKAQIPDPTPSVFGPVIDVATNKNYLGVPIESEGMQYLYPTERKRDYTTKLAVALSKGMDEIGIQLSPIQLDYMLDSYSGGFLRQFRITGEELSDLPVIGDLMLRDPSYPKRQLNEYFSDWEVLRQKKQSGIATRAEIRELNRIDGFYKTYKTLQGNITKAKKANNQALVEKYSNLLRERLERYGYK